VSTLAIVLVALAAAPFDATFEAASKAYDAGQYEEAVRQYASIAAAGVAEPELFYNLGNAAFRAGDVATAIANYERALQLDPRMEDAAHNLDYAIAGTGGRLARPLRPGWQEALLFWDGRLRPGEVRWLAIVCWVLFWAILLWRVATRQKYQLPLAATFLLLAGASMMSLYAKTFPLQIAVARAPEVPVRIGASPADTVRYTLSPGDRVKVEAERDGWLRVATASGERGWAQAENFVRVGPPYLPPPSSGPSGAIAAESSP
jgi:hypothetical protein